MRTKYLKANIYHCSQNSLISILKTKNSLAFIEIIVILHKSMLLCERTIFYDFDQFNLFRL